MTETIAPDVTLTASAAKRINAILAKQDGAAFLRVFQHQGVAQQALVPVIALGGMNPARARELDWPRWGAIDGQNVGPLQDGVLTWRSDKARPIYANGGFREPHSLRCGQGDTPDGARAWIEVEDDGPGIPASERLRVLQRFYRVPGTAGEGNGLGLAIADEIARVHATHLQLDNGAEGRGLRVRVTLDAITH